VSLTHPYESVEVRQNQHSIVLKKPSERKLKTASANRGPKRKSLVPPVAAPEDDSPDGNREQAGKASLAAGSRGNRRKKESSAGKIPP